LLGWQKTTVALWLTVAVDAPFRNPRQHLERIAPEPSASDKQGRALGDLSSATPRDRRRLTSRLWSRHGLPLVLCVGPGC